MQPNKLGHALGLSVLAVAALNSIAAITLPVREGRPGALLIASWFLLLILHAALYWYGETIRRRFGAGRYVAAQAAVVFAFGLLGTILPVVVCLYIALIAEVVTLAAETWGSASITVAAIALFAVNAMLRFDLYRGATAGLLLAITGVVTHALAGLRKPPIAVTAMTGGHSDLTNGRDAGLTGRELEVLRALVSGARSSQIANDLGITERTVKAHLASIYQKLGVESRAAAVAAAVQRRLIE
jgi:DNA-binding CsgD family transcriptional regulator